MKIKEVNGYALKRYEILNPPNLAYCNYSNKHRKGTLLLEKIREFLCYSKYNNFYYNNSKFILNATGIWYNTEVIGKVILPEANKT